MTDVFANDLLRAMTAPRSVALVGASATPGKLTARPLEFLRAHGYAGQIFPVNPSRASVMGLPAYPSISAIPEAVEHAYVLLDTEAAIVAVEECAKVGVKVVSVLADGFAEAGADGRRRQDHIKKVAAESGILLIGPNSTGIVATHSGFTCTTNAAFASSRLTRGRIAVLSQSGSLIGTLLSRGEARGIGYSTFVSVGNEAAAGIGEIGRILLADPHTDGFVLFLETVRNPAMLARFAREAHALGKSVSAYVVGQSDEGRALAVSHTGALTGSAAALDAFLRSLGIRQLRNFETLIEGPPTFARLRRSAARPCTVTVVTTTGGGGAMIVDQIAARGGVIAGCGPESGQIFAARGIPIGHGKLVDVTLAGANYDTMRMVVSTLLADPRTGVLVVAIGSSAQFKPESSVQPLIDAWAAAGTDRAPMVAFPIPHAPEGLALLEAAGIPGFRTVEACAETIALLLEEPMVAPVPVASLPPALCDRLANQSGEILDEVASGTVFGELGLRRPAHVYVRPGASIPDSLPFPYPVVAKLISPDLPHKTEAGAVTLGISSHAHLIAAVEAMHTAASAFHPGYRPGGVLIQETCRGVGEAVIGLTRDALVGPVVTVGVGGIMTEIYRDVAVRPAPTCLTDAVAMIAEVRGFRMLSGYRNRPPGDLEALAHAVVAISSLAGIDKIEEAEVNPVLVQERGSGVVLLDALIRLRSDAGQDA